MSVLLLLLAFQSSQPGPSFDCGAALTPVEQAICADTALASLDRDMASRYAQARRGASPARRAALVADQRWFLNARNEWYENRGRWSDFPDLGARLTSRAAFLSALRPPPASLAGRWANLAGEVRVRQTGDGEWVAELETAQPVNARWICKAEVRGRLEGGVLQGQASGETGYRVSLVQRDGVLVVEENRVVGHQGPPGYCGMNGSVAGRYLPVREGR